MLSGRFYGSYYARNEPRCTGLILLRGSGRYRTVQFLRRIYPPRRGDCSSIGYCRRRDFSLCEAHERNVSARTRKYVSERFARATTQNGKYQVAYWSSTTAPTASRASFIALASSGSAPSLTVAGAPSTSSFGSFRPRPVASLTALITLIFS